MNRDLLMKLILASSDALTAENLCQAYPNLVPDPKSDFWKVAIKERFGDDLIPNYQEMYLDLKLSQKPSQMISSPSLFLWRRFPSQPLRRCNSSPVVNTP